MRALLVWAWHDDSGRKERKMEIRTVLVTAPDKDTGVSLARSLVAERIVACGNVVPDLVSVYRWEGEVHEDPEVLLVLKTTAERMDALTRRVRELHPYDVPEVLALPVKEGAEEYMEWVVAECREAKREG